MLDIIIFLVLILFSNFCFKPAKTRRLNKIVIKANNKKQKVIYCGRAKRY